eukprot:150418-Amorphochlora_amoeboformis.AAC.2
MATVSSGGIRARLGTCDWTRLEEIWLSATQDECGKGKDEDSPESKVSASAVVPPKEYPVGGTHEASWPKESVWTSVGQLVSKQKPLFLFWLSVTFGVTLRDTQ